MCRTCDETLRHPRGRGQKRGARVKKFIIAGVASLLTLISIVGIAQAQGKAGPNGNNEHGLCTAYFNGQKSGWQGDGPPPFSSLSVAAESYETSNGGGGDNEATSNEAASDIYSFCNDASIDPKGIGGNPCHGRYPDMFDSCPS